MDQPAKDPEPEAPADQPSLLVLSMHKEVLKYLKSVPKKFRVQILDAIEELRANPFPNGIERVENSVVDGQQVYRVRCGDYRVLFYATATNLCVLRVRHRKDVYRNL